MGLVKKYKNGNKTEEPKKLLTYENIGTYDADEIASEFSEAKLEAFANKNHMTGDIRQLFMEKANAMASAIKSGNVTRNASGFDVGGEYADVLKNKYTEDEIKNKKEQGDVGRGASVYTGDYQRSHGAFTTQKTENFRKENHASGLVGTYLKSILDDRKTLEQQEKEKKETDEKTPYNFNSIFTNNILGGNVNLLTNWMSNSKESRIKSLSDLFNGDIDYARWAGSLENYDEDQLKQKVQSIATDLNAGNLESAQNTALSLGIPLNDYLKDNTPEKVVKTDDELFEEQFLAQNPGLKAQWHLISDEDKQALLMNEKVKSLTKLQELYDTQWKDELEAAWNQLQQGVTPGDYDYNAAYDKNSIINFSQFKPIYNGGVLNQFDFSTPQAFIKSMQTVKKSNNNYKKAVADTINSLYNEVATLHRNLQEQSLKFADSDNNAVSQRDYSQYIKDISKFINAYDYINLLVQNVPELNKLAIDTGSGQLPELDINSFYNVVESGPYKDWIHLAPAYTDKGKYTIIFNNNKYSPEYGQIKRVRKALLDKDEFTADYETTHKKRKVLQKNKEGGILIYKLGGYTPLGNIKYDNTAVPIVSETPGDLASIVSDTSNEHTANQNPVLMKGWDVLPEDETMSAADISRLVGLGGDLVSLFGGIPGAAGGLTSIGAHGYADIKDWLDGNQTGWDAASNIMTNTALSIIGLVPGAASLKALKGTKYVGMAGKVLKHGLRTLALLGAITDTLNGQYSQSIDNLLHGNLSTQDAKTLVNLISTILMYTGGGTAKQRLRKDKFSGYGMQGNVTVRSAGGKDITMSHDQFMRLANTDKSNRNNVFQSIQKEVMQKADPNVDLTKVELEQLPRGFEFKWGWPRSNNKIDVTADNRVITPRTYTDWAGYTREANPSWLTNRYVTGAGTPAWVRNTKRWIGDKTVKLTERGNAIKQLPSGAKQLGNSNAYEYNGTHYEKKNGFFNEITKEEALKLQNEAASAAPITPTTPASTPAAKPLSKITLPEATAKRNAETTQNLIKEIQARQAAGQKLTDEEKSRIQAYFHKYGGVKPRNVQAVINDISANKLKQGGPLGFASNVVNKYQNGGKNGIKHKGSWYSTGGKQALDEVLKRLTSDDEKYKDYYKKLNDYQKRHYDLYTTSGFANNPENTYYKHDNVRSYQQDYNNEGYNSIAIWPFFDQAYTVNGTNPIAQDRKGTEGVDGIYSGITDNRRILGRYGDFEEADLKDYTDKFKQAGYKFYLDPTTNYYMLDLLNPDENNSEKPEGDNTDGTQTGDQNNTSGKPSSTNLVSSNLYEDDLNTDKDMQWKRVLDKSTALETAKLGLLNGGTYYANDESTKWPHDSKGYIHNFLLHIGDYLTLAKNANEDALQYSLAGIPLTPNANLYANRFNDVAFKRGLSGLQAATQDSNKFYETNMQDQLLQNQNYVENVNRHDFNSASLAAKIRYDAQAKADSIRTAFSNTGGYFSRLGLQAGEFRAQAQEAYKQLLLAKYTEAKDQNRYRTYLEMNKPNANYDDITRRATAENDRLSNENYSNIMRMLQKSPYWYDVPTGLISYGAGGLKLTTSQKYILESSKEFNKAMRENRREFYRNIRANNKRKR